LTATLLKSTPTGQQLCKIKILLLGSGGKIVSVEYSPFGQGKNIFLSTTLNTIGLWFQNI